MVFIMILCLLLYLFVEKNNGYFFHSTLAVDIRAFNPNIFVLASKSSVFKGAGIAVKIGTNI